MIEAKYLTNNGWTDWEPVQLEWALNIASVYGNRSGNEFLFEDLPRGEQEYATGDDTKEFCTVALRMGECPCKKSAVARLWETIQIQWWYFKQDVELWTKHHRSKSVQRRPASQPPTGHIRRILIFDEDEGQVVAMYDGRYRNVFNDRLIYKNVICWWELPDIELRRKSHE